jgi:hypothetical protein
MNFARWIGVGLFSFLTTVGGSLLPTKVMAADLLTMNLAQTSATSTAGGTLSFTGVITNRTGAALNSTDLFLDFIGYDYSVLAPSQILGSTPFTLPNLTFSSVVNLFSVDIAATTVPGDYQFTVALEDVRGNISTSTLLNITVGAVSLVPEPGIVVLLACGAFGLLLWSRNFVVKASSRDARLTSPL